MYDNISIGSILKESELEKIRPIYVNSIYATPTGEKEDGELLYIITSKGDTNANGDNVVVTDNAGRAGNVSVFGDTIIGTRVPSVASQFRYGANLEEADVDGTIEIIDSELYVNDGYIETKQVLQYIPGHEAYIYFTARQVLAGVQRAGFFDGENGYFIEFQADETIKAIRRQGGVDSEVPFIEDIETGNNRYNFEIDVTKGNVYRISFGYLGFANATFEVLCDCGKWIPFARLDYPNKYDRPHIFNTYLPARLEAVSGKIATASFSMGIVDGGGSTPSNRDFSRSVGPIATLSGGNAIVTFRSKDLFSGFKNYIPSLLQRIAISTDGAQNVTVALIKNMEITNTPTYLDAYSTSVLQYSLDATVTAGTGKQLIAWEIAKVADYTEMVKDLNLLLYAGETATFYAVGNNNVNLTINWVEKF